MMDTTPVSLPGTIHIYMHTNLVINRSKNIWRDYMAELKTAHASRLPSVSEVIFSTSSNVTREEKRELIGDDMAGVA